MYYELMDLHNHTTWSDGVNTPEEIIENAIGNGVSILGISDHFATIKCKSIPIPRENLGDYVHSIELLKKKYKEKIKILTGVEICMNKEWCNIDLLPFTELNDLDYVLFEYIDLFKDSISLSELEGYASKIRCKKGLAHTDLFQLEKKYGLENIIRILKEMNIFWEINVNPGYYYFDNIIINGNIAKIKKLFNMLKECNVEIAVGSDTHSLFYYDIERLKVGNALARYEFTNL